MGSNIYKVIGNQFHIDANHVELHINILWISEQEEFEFATNKASPFIVQGGVRTDFTAILGFELSTSKRVRRFSEPNENGCGNPKSQNGCVQSGTFRERLSVI